MLAGDRGEGKRGRIRDASKGGGRGAPGNSAKKRAVSDGGGRRSREGGVLPYKTDWAAPTALT